MIGTGTVPSYVSICPAVSARHTLDSQPERYRRLGHVTMSGLVAGTRDSAPRLWPVLPGCEPLLSL